MTTPRDQPLPGATGAAPTPATDLAQRARIARLQRRVRGLKVRNSLLTVAFMVVLAMLVTALTTGSDSAATAEADPAAWANWTAGLVVALIVTGFGLTSLIATVLAWRHGTQPHPFTTIGVLSAVLLLAIPLIVTGLESALAGTGPATAPGLFDWVESDLRTFHLFATGALALIGVFNNAMAVAMRRADAAHEAPE